MVLLSGAGQTVEEVAASLGISTRAVYGEMEMIPAELRCTRTIDNGTEMARFKNLEEAFSERL